MSRVGHLGRRLPALLGTLAVLCLIGAGGSYGISRIARSEAEFAATVEARDQARDVLEPELRPVDGDAPARGERYQELRSFVDRRVLSGPTDEARIWGLDGTVLFATDPALVGQRRPAPSGIELGSAPSGASRSVVDGDRFRTFTWVGLRNAADLVAIEIARPYAPIVAESARTWQPWVLRASVAAVLFGSLAAAAAAGVWVAGRRRGGREGAEDEPAPLSRSRWTPGMPEYMRPGYREEVEARRRLEEEQLVAALRASNAVREPKAVALPGRVALADEVALVEELSVADDVASANEVTLQDEGTLADHVTLAEDGGLPAPRIEDAPPDLEDLATRLRRIARQRELDEDTLATRG
jgi:hypothetical protein